MINRPMVVGANLLGDAVLQCREWLQRTGDEIGTIVDA